MTDLNARDAKLIQYLNEAYGKEKELARALEGHIQMTTRAPYRKRLEEHLRETKAHANAVSRRIKQLGGNAEEVDIPGPGVIAGAAGAGMSVVQQATALAKGGLHAVRGTGEQEKMLKNAKTELFNEAEEIANYTAIETLAQAVGDKDTAQVARGIRKQEERMRSFLERLIPQLTQAMAKEEIPAALRNGASTRRRSRSSGRSALRASGSGARASGSTRSSASGSSTSRKSSGSARPKSSGSARPKSSGSSRSKAAASGSRTTGSARSAAAKRSGGSSAAGSSSARGSASKGSGTSARSTRAPGSRSSGSSSARSRRSS